MPAETTTTIYHFGYDDQLFTFRGYAYRSVNDFESEELPIGIGIKPPIKYSLTENIQDDLINIIRIQRDQDLSSPILERIGIGGDIHIFFLEPGSISIQRVFRFEDYESLYSDMCTRLPSNIIN